MVYDSYLLPSWFDPLFESFQRWTAASFEESVHVPMNRGFKGGFEQSFVTVVLTILLEVVSWRTVRALLKQKGGPTLYANAVAINFCNHFVYGIPVYIIASIFFCQDNSISHPADFCAKTLAIVTFQAFWFYAVHRAFHTTPSLYKHHRFHHRFNTHVPPMTANAVSFVEYIGAYILPFAVAAALLRPHDLELRAAVSIVSVCNLLEHTPPLEEISKRMPRLFTSTHGHLEHHRKLTVHYAAPTFNIDYLVELVEGFGKKKVL